MATNHLKFYIILQFCHKKPSYLLEIRLQKALDRGDFLKLAWKFSFQGNIGRSSYINISLHHFYKCGCLLECQKILFKYGKLFWSLWSFLFAFEKSSLSFLFRRIISIKLSNCFTSERLYPRNACSDTHVCNTFLLAPECLCNISVHILYSSSLFLLAFQFASRRHNLGSMTRWESAGWYVKLTWMPVSWRQCEICWRPPCTSRSSVSLSHLPIHPSGIKETKLTTHLPIFSSILKGGGEWIL